MSYSNINELGYLPQSCQVIYVTFLKIYRTTWWVNEFLHVLLGNNITAFCLVWCLYIKIRIKIMTGHLCSGLPRVYSTLKRSERHVLTVNKESHSFTWQLHVYPQMYMSRPAFTPQPQSRASPHFGLYSFSRPTEGKRLSWPRWLVKYRSGKPAQRLSPIPVPTDR